MVAADTLHCSKVRAFLVTSKLIGIEPGGLIFLDYSGSSSPSSLSSQIQGQGQEQTQTQGQGHGQGQQQTQGQGQQQTQGQGQAQGHGQTQGQGHVSGFSMHKPIGDIVPEEGPVAVRYFYLDCHTVINLNTKQASNFFLRDSVLAIKNFFHGSVYA